MYNQLQYIIHKSVDINVFQQTRGCKTLKHCQKELEMLLEDDETQTLAGKTVKRCSKTSWLQNDSYPTAPCALAEILPETTVRAQFDQIEIFFAYYKFTYSTYFLTFSNSFYVYTRGILGCLLGFWPLGQNPAGAISIYIYIVYEFLFSVKVLLVL